MKRTARLTIETRRVVVIRRATTSRRTMCGECGKAARFVTADEAARLAQVGARAIYRCVEGGSLHFTEENETLLICLNSLLKWESEIGKERPAHLG